MLRKGNGIMNVYLINGSPKGEQSTSQMMIEEIIRLFSTKSMTFKTLCIKNCIDHSLLEEAFQSLYASDRIIFVYPLFMDSIPSHLLDFMAKFERFILRTHLNKKSQSPQVYAIVQSGSFEGKKNQHALDIMQLYCDKAGLNWRFGLGIGGGVTMMNIKGMPKEDKVKKKVYDALKMLREDLEESKQGRDNRLVNPSVPKRVFMFMGNRHWKDYTKNNQLRKKDLYAKPYI